ncbi:MAG: tyrosine-type recombinase/integrase [Myxococcales bacterium]|nr:tyrosine-type recombinase/integrase [Myxococcales bacterium]
MAVLNDTTVRRARPRATKYEITCAAVRGFALRVLPSGRKVYLVRTRRDGRDVRVSIGPADAMSCDQARVRALQLLAGDAPHTPPPAPRAPLHEPSPSSPQAAARAPTFAAFARRYERDHVARSVKPRTAARYRQQLRMYLLPALGDTPLDAITPAAVEALHASMAATPFGANNALRILRHMFTKACDWGALPAHHPAPTRTVRMYRERTRERFLSPEERARLEAVLRQGEETPPGRDGCIRWSTAAAIRLLSLTGMRRNEVLDLTWAMVDARHRCLRLPDSKTGQKVVPISSHVLALLDALRSRARPDVPWVLYSRTGTRVHEASLGRAWSTIRGRAGLADVRLHDLRHSAASDALMSGVPIEVVRKILGHASIQTTARYAHLSDRVVQAAVESMGDSIVAAQGVPVVKARRGRPKRR